MALLCLIPQVLVEVGISNLFDRLNIVHGVNVIVVVVHINSDFLESSLGEKESLNSRQRRSG